MWGCVDEWGLTLKRNPFCLFPRLNGVHIATGPRRQGDMEDGYIE